MRKIWASAFCLLIMAAAVPAAAQVNQLFEEYGVSPRDMAMGGAFTAVADDYSASFYNPAGLYQIEGSHIHFGYRAIDPVLYMRLEGFHAPVDFADYPSTQVVLLGLATDLKLSGIFNNAITERVSFGFAFAMGEYWKSSTTFYDHHVPYMYRYFDRPVSLMSFYVSFSVKLTEWWAIGGGFVPAPTDTMIHATIRTDTYLPSIESKSKQGTISRAFGKIEPLAGIMLKWPGVNWRDKLSLGMVWRDEVHTCDGKGMVENTTYVHMPDGSVFEGVPVSYMELFNMTGYTPMQSAAGLCVRPIRGMVLSVEEIWKNWRAWMNYNMMHPRPRFHDTWVTKAGIEHTFFFEKDWFQRFTLRGGYYYEPSPAPDMSGPWNILDNDKHVASLGAGLQLGNLLGVIVVPTRLNLGYQEHLLVPRHTENNRDAKYPAIDTGGHIWTFAVDVEIFFK